MNKFTKKLVLSTVVFGVILSVLVSSLTLYIEPAFNLYWLFGTCIYFILLEVGVVLYIISVSKKIKRDKKLVNAYLLTKVVKIFLSLFIIAYYLLAVKTDIKAYLVAFAILYLCYLIMESILFIKIEKRLKKESHEE